MCLEPLISWLGGSDFITRPIVTWYYAYVITLKINVSWLDAVYEVWMYMHVKIK